MSWTKSDIADIDVGAIIDPDSQDAKIWVVIFLLFILQKHVCSSNENSYA